MSLRSHSSGISTCSKRALERRGEDDVELVEIALVLDQKRAREMVEILDRLFGEVAVQSLHQGQIFARRDRHMRLPQRSEEGQEHRRIIA